MAIPRVYSKVRTKQRPRDLRRRYGLTPAEYDAVLHSHSGKCSLCNRSAAVLDHSHRSSRVRGALCSPCNTALGQLGDDVEGMCRVIIYLVGDRQKARVERALQRGLRKPKRRSKGQSE